MRFDKPLTEMTAEEHDAAIIKAATLFTAVRQSGQGAYERHDADSLDGARAYARIMGRAIIYAVTPEGRQAMVETYKGPGRIEWQKVPNTPFASARYADVDSGRFYACRTAPRSRTFFGVINGHQVGCWDTIDMACSQTAKIARERGMAAFHPPRK